MERRNQPPSPFRTETYGGDRAERSRTGLWGPPRRPYSPSSVDWTVGTPRPARPLPRRAGTSEDDKVTAQVEGPRGKRRYSWCPQNQDQHLLPPASGLGSSRRQRTKVKTRRV